MTFNYWLFNKCEMRTIMPIQNLKENINIISNLENNRFVYLKIIYIFFFCYLSKSKQYHKYRSHATFQFSRSMKRSFCWCCFCYCCRWRWWFWLSKWNMVLNAKNRIFIHPECWITCTQNATRMTQLLQQKKTPSTPQAPPNDEWHKHWASKSDFNIDNGS